MASRKISDLNSELRPLAEAHINRVNAILAKLDASAFITCTYRSNDEQAKLYAIGRTVKGRKVTNAKPGQSKHNIVDPKTDKPAAESYDIAILVNGKLNWNLDDPVWEIAGKAGEELGLEWAGRWERFREGPHFQLRRKPASRTLYDDYADPGIGLKLSRQLKGG